MVIFTWHPIWATDQRFYLPILPVLVYWIGRGICRIGGRRKNKNTTATTYCSNPIQENVSLEEMKKAIDKIKSDNTLIFDSIMGNRNFRKAIENKSILDRQEIKTIYGINLIENNNIPDNVFILLQGLKAIGMINAKGKYIDLTISQKDTNH